MVKVIIYDEAYEIFNIERLLNDDVEIVGYLKNDKEYFGDKISGKLVYSLDDLGRLNTQNSFDYIIVNSKKYGAVYDKIIEFNIDPVCLIDVSFFLYDHVKSLLKEKFSYSIKEEVLDFDILFLGRSFIREEIFRESFNNYINLSNMLSDIHYDYHLLYYLIKNNKINTKSKIGVFMSYSMLYENIDSKEDRFGFIQIFEEYFKVHNNENRNSLFSNYCFDSFRNNISKLFKRFNTDLVKGNDDLKICDLELKDIKYMSDVETLNYNECSMVSFRMNRNILNQYIKLVKDNFLDLFFIIPPVHKLHRTYINKTLQNEFYMVLNRYLNKDLYVFDYFDKDFDDSYFSSPTTLNTNGCREFFKILNNDINNKYLNVRLCNNL